MTHPCLVFLSPALALVLVPLSGCIAESSMEDGVRPAETSICNSGSNCCKKEELVCRGDPDGQTICTCHRHWSCDDYIKPEKCEQNPADVPDGKGGWSCQAAGPLERCVRQGTDVPEGKNGWTCQVQDDFVMCSRPTNTPDGGEGWFCAYSGELKQCVKNPDVKLDGGATQDSASPSKQEGGVPGKKDAGGKDVGATGKKDSGSTEKDSGPPPFVPPPGWTCQKGPHGETICKKSGAGLPPNGSGGPGGKGSFQCYWNNGMITCEGSSNTPPAGTGWGCVPNPDVGGWRCKHPVGSGDTPGGSGKWSCISSTAEGGITCVQQPPSTTPGAECTPGTKKWCDGMSYCGWGQVTCGASGQWQRKFNWTTLKFEEDCWELKDGRRANTVCACYFTFFNKECCETPDCVVPPGSNGQICPASPGWYCDYCNPLQAGSCKEPGAHCITTTKNETFCGADCAGGKPCPSGGQCRQVKKGSQYFWQCMPPDESCYF